MTTMIDRFYADNDMVTEPPEPCAFHVGSCVLVTNAYGLEYGPKRVIGFAKPEHVLHGRFIHVDSDSPWFPYSPESLRPA